MLKQGFHLIKNFNYFGWIREAHVEDVALTTLMMTTTKARINQSQMNVNENFFVGTFRAIMKHDEESFQIALPHPRTHRFSTRRIFPA